MARTGPHKSVTKGVSVRWANTLTMAAVVVAAMPWTAGSASAESIVDAVESAIAYHPQIRRDQALAVAADQAIDVAYSDFLPDLDLSASGGGEITRSPSTVRRGDGTVGMVRREGRATASQLIFDFFETSNRVAAARQDLRSSHATVQATTEAIARLAVQSYVAVQESREQVALAERNVADHVAIVDLIRGRAEAGRAAEADLDQAISRLALVRARLIEAQGQERLATSRYTETVGAPPGDLERPALPDFLEAEDLDAALATAMDRNPAAHATTASWDARRREVDVARSAYYPKFDVVGTAGAGEDLDGTSGFRGDASVLLRMRWNLFSGFGDLARTRTAIQNANAASRIDAESRRVIREAVRVAYEALETSENRLDPLRRDVEASRRTFEAYRQQYDLGQRTLLDLLDARDEQFDSESDLVTGEFNVYRASYDLLFGTGLILDHFGITVYQQELLYDERGEGIHAANTTGQPGPAEAEAADTAETAAKTAAEAAGPRSGILGEEAANLPGAGEFGFWLSGDEQRWKADLDAEERAMLLQSSALTVPRGEEIRREIADIEVQNVPEMATLPEAAVAILPGPSMTDYDAVVLGGFQQDDSLFGGAPFLGEAAPAAVTPVPKADEAAAGPPLQEGRLPSAGLESAALGDRLGGDEETLAYRALASLPLGAAGWLSEGDLPAAQ